MILNACSAASISRFIADCPSAPNGEVAMLRALSCQRSLALGDSEALAQYHRVGVEIILSL